MNGPAEFVAYDEVVLAVPGWSGALASFTLDLAVLAKRCDGSPVECHVSSAARRLRRSHDDVVAGGGDGEGNGKPAQVKVKVNVAPAEAEHRSAAHARGAVSTSDSNAVQRIV